MQRLEQLLLCDRDLSSVVADAHSLLLIAAEVAVEHAHAVQSLSHLLQHIAAVAASRDQ